MISVDVDECSIETHNCSENATCIDTDNSYTCECKDGYTGDGVNCTGMSGFNYHIYTIKVKYNFGAQQVYPYGFFSNHLCPLFVFCSSTIVYFRDCPSGFYRFLHEVRDRARFWQKVFFLRKRGKTSFHVVFQISCSFLWNCSLKPIWILPDASRKFHVWKNLDLHGCLVCDSHFRSLIVFWFVKMVRIYSNLDWRQIMKYFQNF